MAINQIEAFAKEMKGLGETYSFNPLKKLGEDLYIAAQTFDIDQIKQNLRDFNKMIKQ